MPSEECCLDHRPAPRKIGKPGEGCAWEQDGPVTEGPLPAGNIPGVSSRRKNPMLTEGLSVLSTYCAPAAIRNPSRASARPSAALLCSWHCSYPIIQVRNWDGWLCVPTWYPDIWLNLWVCLWGCFRRKLASESVDSVKHFALPSVGRLHPVC